MKTEKLWMKGFLISRNAWKLRLSDIVDDQQNVYYTSVFIISDKIKFHNGWSDIEGHDEVGSCVHGVSGVQWWVWTSLAGLARATRTLKIKKTWKTWSWEESCWSSKRIRRSQSSWKTWCWRNNNWLQVIHLFYVLCTLCWTWQSCEHCICKRHY